MLLLVFLCVIYSGVLSLEGSYALEQTKNATDKDVCRDFKNRVVPTGRPFYDGCNYCVCGKGGQSRCTKRVCDAVGNSTEVNITGSPATDEGVSPNSMSKSTDPLPANQTNQQTFGSRPALASTNDPSNNQNKPKSVISLNSDELASAKSNELTTTQTPLTTSSPEQPRAPTNTRPPMDNNEPTFSETIANVLLQTFPVRALIQSPHLDFIRQLLLPTASKQVEQKPVAQNSGVMQNVDITSQSNVDTSAITQTGDITTPVTQSVDASPGIKPNGESAAHSVPKERGFGEKPKTSWILDSSGDEFVNGSITTKQLVRSSADSELANTPMTSKRPVKQVKGDLTEDPLTQKHPAKQAPSVSAGDNFTKPIIILSGFPAEQVIVGQNVTQPFNVTRIANLRPKEFISSANKSNSRTSMQKELDGPTKHPFDLSNSSSSPSGNNLISEDPRTPKLPEKKIWTMNFEIPRNLFPIFLNYRSHPRLNLRPVNTGPVNSLDSVRDNIMSRLLHNIF